MPVIHRTNRQSCLHLVFSKLIWKNSDELCAPHCLTFLFFNSERGARRDLDGDRRPDLYVCSDLASPDRIWLNRGDGGFRAAPATTVPEATGADTFVNAAEKTSDAGVPIVTQLASNARAGDVVTTTVTLPDGSTRVLSTTLKTADIQAGRISQLLTQSNLATDGAYSASTVSPNSL